MLVRITIPKFKEFNPRSDVKHSGWVRLNCKTWTERKLFGASIISKWVWISALCAIGDESFVDGILECKIGWFAGNSGITDVEAVDALKDLHDRGLLVFESEPFETETRARNVHGTSTVRPRNAHGPNVRDVRDVRDETEEIPNFPPKSLGELWNEAKHPDQPKVFLATLASGKERHKSAKARLDENPDPVFWRDIVTKIAASPFCQGRNDRGWKADFDFLIRPDTYAKVLEGKYANRVGPQKSTTPILEPLDRPRSY